MLNIPFIPNQSEKELTLAFYSCHTAAHSNREYVLDLNYIEHSHIHKLITRRRILTYLIPLRILRGHLPTTDLLVEFPALAGLYNPFINAIKKGDIKTYDLALDQREHRLVDLNLWLTLEKARELCIRSLFRKV